MELVVAIAIGVLSVVFICSLLALVLLCRQRRSAAAHWSDKNPMLKYSRDSGTFDQQALYSDHEHGNDSDVVDMLQLSPNIAKILSNNDWIYDATGLVHHSLAILRICHQITDQLSALTFNPVHTNQDAVDDVREWTRRIMPRVDDLVRTMYVCSRRAMQASLLEARAGALVMAVGGVTTAFRSAYPRAAASGELQWLRQAITDMEQHLESLRQAADTEENSQREKVEVVMRGANGASTSTASSPSDSPVTQLHNTNNVNVGASTSRDANQSIPIVGTISNTQTPCSSRSTTQNSSIANNMAALAESEASTPMLSSSGDGSPHNELEDDANNEALNLIMDKTQSMEIDKG